MQPNQGASEGRTFRRRCAVVWPPENCKDVLVYCWTAVQHRSLVDSRCHFQYLMESVWAFRNGLMMVQECDMHSVLNRIHHLSRKCHHFFIHSDVFTILKWQFSTNTMFVHKTFNESFHFHPPVPRSRALARLACMANITERCLIAEKSPHMLGLNMFLLGSVGVLATPPF